MVKIPSDGLTDLCLVGTSSTNYDTRINEQSAIIDPGHVFTPTANQSPEAEDLEQIDPARPTPAKTAPGAIHSLNCKQVQSPPNGLEAEPSAADRIKKKKPSAADRVGGDSRPCKAGKPSAADRIKKPSAADKVGGGDSRPCKAGKEAPGEEKPKSDDGRRGKTRTPLTGLPPFDAFTQLSITDDRLDGVASLPTSGKGLLLDAPAGQQLTYGDYTLNPQRRGWKGYSRVYKVHHRHHSDPVATLLTHPNQGRRALCEFNTENHHHYTGDAVQLLVGLLDAVGATGETLTHWEVQTTHPRLLEVAQYINGNQLKRKGGREWGVEVGDGGAVKGMRVGRSKSPRSFNMYANGKDLSRRNRRYITARTVADGVATPDQEKQLTRLELHIKSREFKGLTYTDANGTEQPVTVRSLLSHSVRLAVFRRQIETAFTFRKRTGKDKYATAQFFDWQAIEQHYDALHSLTGTKGATTRTTALRRNIYARKAGSTFGAKQTIKKLTQDGRAGDYLPKATRPDLEQFARRALLQPDRLKSLTDTLAAVGCEVSSELVLAIVAAHLSNAAGDVADKLSHEAPQIIARAVAVEHGVTDYYRKQLHPAYALPSVRRPRESVRGQNPVGHGV